LDAALIKLGDAAVNVDDDGLKRAVAEFSRATHCVHSANSAKMYGLDGPPSGGEAATFVRALTFLRAEHER
jgi:hypothetical protein